MSDIAVIDVFLSRPTWVGKQFEPGLASFLTRLEDLGFKAHTLGVSDYPNQAPLDEVIRLLQLCRGSVILGYPQIEVMTGTIKGRVLDRPFKLPTEWNHIEAGLAYARGLPLLVIHHLDVIRGIFDRGAINSFIYEKDLSDPTWSLADDITGALRTWRDDVLARSDEERRRLAEHERQESRENCARVLVRLTREDGWAGRGTRERVVIHNHGPADASDVEMAFPDGNSPILDVESKSKLPIPSLPAGTDVKLIAATSSDNHPPFHAELEWTDPLGRLSKCFMLT